MAKFSPWSNLNAKPAAFVPGAEHAEAFAAYTRAPGAAAWRDVYPTPAGEAMLAASAAHFKAEHDRLNRRVRLVYSGATSSSVSFGVFDRLGREIGARAIVDRVTVIEVADDEEPDGQITSWPRTDRLGDFYTYTPHALRNGSSYGASQRTVWFDTAVERNDAADKYLDGARKRANKTAGVETLVD